MCFFVIFYLFFCYDKLFQPSHTLLTYHRPPSLVIGSSSQDLVPKVADNDTHLASPPPPSPKLTPTELELVSSSPPLLNPDTPRDAATHPASMASPLPGAAGEDSDPPPSSSQASSFVEEVPAEVEKQVLDSSMLLSESPSSSPQAQDVEEVDLPTCPIEDPPIEESCESDQEDSSLDNYIAKELEDLMSKLSEASSVEYRLSSSNRVIADYGEHSGVMYEDMAFDGMITCCSK